MTAAKQRPQPPQRARRTLPGTSLLEGAGYVSAANTDIRNTFAAAETRARGGPRTRPMVYLAGSPPGCSGNCDQGWMSPGQR